MVPSINYTGANSMEDVGMNISEFKSLLLTYT